MDNHKPGKWLKFALAFLAACSSCAPTDVATDPDTAAGSKPSCHDVQRRPDGTCCPPGQFFELTSATCIAVGPPECADIAFNAPEKCVPRWCWDWRTSREPGKGNACEQGTAGCHLIGRICTADELAQGHGCNAGDFPQSEEPGDCAPAGYFPGSGVPKDWNGEADTLPPLPPLEASIPPGGP